MNVEMFMAEIFALLYQVFAMYPLCQEPNEETFPFSSVKRYQFNKRDWMLMGNDSIADWKG